MISLFDNKISAISCSARDVYFSQNQNIFTYSATGLANRNNYDIHNDGNENLHKKELKLKLMISLPTAEWWLKLWLARSTGLVSSISLYMKMEI